MSDPQQDFDSLVSTAAAWLLSDAWSREERELAAKIEEARKLDSAFAEAAIDVAARKIAPEIWA